MKFTIYLFSFMLVHIKANFIDDLYGAMHHVETGYEKLLTDVVSDMEDTLQCTISSVEYVLHVHGLIDEPSNYQDKCKGSSTYNVHNPASRTLQYENYNSDHFRDGLDSQIYNSISNVNKTLLQLLDRNENSVFKGVNGEFENETKRLNEVSEMLRKELENIYKNLKDGKIGIDRSSKDAIWNDVKTLEIIQKNSNNSSELKEVRELYDKALDVLKANAGETDDDLKSMISELEKDLHDRKEEIKDNHRKPQPSNTLRNFKDKQESLLKHESKLKNMEESKHESPQNDFESFFSRNDDRESYDEIKNIIEENRKTEMLFNSLSHVGTSVFDSNAFLNF